MKNRLIASAATIAVAATAYSGMAVGLAGSAAGAPPTPADTVFDLGEGVACSFAVRAVLAGKGKTIDLGAGRTIVTAPGQKITITNVASGKTVEYVITGTFHNTTLRNGDVVTQATGRNALLDPIAGFVITAGNFSFTNRGEVNVVPLHGDGKIIDICAALA